MVTATDRTPGPATQPCLRRLVPARQLVVEQALSCCDRNRLDAGHPRDPFHRVDVRRSARRVVVRAGTQVIAETTEAQALQETGLPICWYLPHRDVRTDMLTPSATHTTFPYKGVADYWTVRAGDVEVIDGVWSYPQAFGAARQVTGMLSLLGEGLSVDIAASDDRGR